MTVLTTENPEVAKARGAFYTPVEITRFLSTWAIRSSDDWILEPSAGNGAFLNAIDERLVELSRDEPSGGILAIEREPEEVDKARRLVPRAEVKRLDFFDLDPGTTRRFTAVVGNPPYIRYQSFRGLDRTKALARSEAQGIELTGLASSWAHFVVHAVAFLEVGGRLALVLPAELLHTDYAAPVRALLMRRFRSVTVVAFDRAAFPAAQVDAVLLLASDDGPVGFRVVRVRNAAGLDSLDVSDAPSSTTSPARWSASVDQAAGDVYQEVIASHGGHRLGDWAHVDIGFVSGANDFFMMTASRAAELGLPPSVLTPAVRRPSDVPGLYVRDDEVNLLLDLASQTSLDGSILKYIAVGEARDLHERYKCRSRTPWFAVPLPKRMPDAFLPYMHHRAPRLIVNARGARNSNLLHGVALKPDAPSPVAVAVAMASSLTLLSAELEGRAYGGGVLKLETKEAERLWIPWAEFGHALTSHAAQIDLYIRQGDFKRAAVIVDGILDLPHNRLWGAYETMRDRRLGRAKGD